MAESTNGSLNDTLGVLEIGILLSSSLFGMLTIQTYTYYSSFPNDMKMLKTLVGVTWLLELAHTICEWDTIYLLTITDYGQSTGTIKGPISYNILIFFSGCIEVIVQYFFAYRVWKFGGRLYVPILCSLLSSVDLVMSTVISVFTFMQTNVLQFEHQWGWLVTTHLVVTAFVDVVLTASLSFYLKKRRRSALQRTAKLIDHLMAWVIRTGLLTSVTAIISVILSETLPKTNFAWWAVYTCLARVYMNSLMTTLNSRKITDDGIIDIDSRADTLYDRRLAPKTAAIAIEMSQFTEVSEPRRISNQALKQYPKGQ